MNIFVTSPCPELSAQYLDNKRVVKMCVESAQILSTALYHQGVWRVGMYKPTHHRHPCVLWAASDDRNYSWLYRHWCHLMVEYARRYQKVHSSSRLLSLLCTKTHTRPLPDFFVNCAANLSKGISYKHMDDVFLAYQCYLNDRWDTDKEVPTWDCVA